MLKKIQKGLLVCLFLSVLVTSCAKDDNKIVAFDQALVVEIIAGPADGGTVSNNANFAFEWRARGGGSNVSFTVQLSGVDASPVSTSETYKSYDAQLSGSYTFRVNASGGGSSASA